MSQLQKISRFDLVNKKIHDGIKNFAETGLLIIEMRDGLYRDRYKSFKEYADKEFNRDYNWLWRMAECAKIKKSFPDIEIPNESTAMEIRKIAVPQRRQVVSEALKQSEGKLSAKAIQNAAASLPERKNAVKLPKDGTGIDIPPEIQEFWNRNEEIKFLIGMIKKVRLTMQEADKSGDRLFCKMDRQGVISRLIMCEQEIESAENFAVCPECNGVFLDKSCICKGRGTFSEYWWKTIDENIRKLRPIFKEYK